MATPQSALNAGQPNVVPDAMQAVSMGDILDGLRPRLNARTGLTSQTTHVHDVAGAILSVDDGAAAPLAIISSGSPGAGEVLVTYDAEGLATLEFSGAVTAYSVTQLALPASHATNLASDLGSSF